MLKRLLAVMLVGAVYVASAMVWPEPALAQVVSQRVGVCDPKWPARCIKPDTAGAIPITGAAGEGLATEATLQDVADNTAETVTELQTPATSIPPIEPTADTTLAVATATSASAEACKVFKASAGNAYSLGGNVNVASTWIMVFNLTAAPADGAVTPALSMLIPAAGPWSLEYGTIPGAFSTGITVCASSTGPFSKTAYSTNNILWGRVK